MRVEANGINEPSFRDVPLHGNKSFDRQCVVETLIEQVEEHLDTKLPIKEFDTIFNSSKWDNRHTAVYEGKLALADVLDKLQLHSYCQVCQTATQDQAYLLPIHTITHTSNTYIAYLYPQ